MPKRCRDELEEDESIPLPIQAFLWRQTSPFIRPRQTRQQDPQISVEQREACKSYEKVLVQNICFNLPDSLTNAIKKISRWKLIQCALPHVIHSCSTLLYRKNQYNDKLNASDTKLLYTLHWIILDASEECIDAELEQNIIKPPEHYLLPVTTIEVFIFQFAPLVTFLKNSDFLTNFRLENGYKLWSPIFNHQHPEISSFTHQVKPKKSIFTSTRCERSKAADKFDDIFLGDTDDKSKSSLEHKTQNNDRTKDEQVNKIGSNIVGTATIANALPSASKEKMSKEEEAKANLLKNKEYSKGHKLVDPSMGTFLDVAVLRCLFASQWLEEGILWSLLYLEKRLKSIREDMKNRSTRPRSSSFPLPYQKLDSIVHSVADNIRERRASRDAKKDGKQNKSDTEMDSSIATALQTGNSLNANLIDTSVRRNSYTPSNVSGAEFPETKSIKFKKQRTEEQLLDPNSVKCSNVSASSGVQSVSNKDKDDQQQQRGFFLTNLRSDIQKFGQKRKPKSALSAIKKDHHQKSRPIRCSSFDILDTTNSKLIKQSSVQSNSSSSATGQATIAMSGVTSVLSGTFSSSTSYTNPITSTEPSQSQLETNKTNLSQTVIELQQLQSSQLLKLKNETINDKNLLQGINMPTLSQEDLTTISSRTIQQTIITTTTSVTQSITQSIIQSTEHQPAEKRNSNESASSTDTTTTINSSTYSVSTTTAATISGSLQVDTAGTSTNLIDDNPIITITEHSPISSSTNQFFIGNSSKQQSDGHVQTQTSNSNCSAIQFAQQNQIISDNVKKIATTLPIKRSLTDSKICYFRPSEIEALGTLNYITKSGQLCLLVILKAVHNISLRENVCTPRVCQGLTNILNELVSLGLLDYIKFFEKNSSSNRNKAQQHHQSSGYKYLKFRSDDKYSALQLFLDTSMNVFRHIGCEYGCNKQVKPSDVSKTRQDLHALLFKLHDTSEIQFLNYFRELIDYKQLNELVDIFHSYLGFCTERPLSANVSRESSRKPTSSNANKLTPTNSNQPSTTPSKSININVSVNTNLNVSIASSSSTVTETANLTSPQQQQTQQTQQQQQQQQLQTNENHSPKLATMTGDKLTPTSPKPSSSKKTMESKKDKEQLMIKQRNFKIEAFVVKCTFSQLVERLTKMTRILNHFENLSTYCDIRQMLIFIKTYHNNTFRRSALNFLIESTEQLKLQAERLSQQKQTKDDVELTASESGQGGVNFYINDDPQPAFDSKTNVPTSSEKQNRKSFFKRRNLKASSSQSVTGEESVYNEQTTTLNQQQSTCVSDSELPLIASSVDQLNQLADSDHHPSNVSKTSLPQLRFEGEICTNSIKPLNIYILDMLKTKGEETLPNSNDLIFKSGENVDQIQSLSLRGNYSFAKDRLSTSFTKSDQNNNQEKQINSDGVFVFSATAGSVANMGLNKEDSQAKIFTVSNMPSSNLYSGNTLAVAPINGIRRPSFQSRTYLGKHLGFTRDFNGRSIHKPRKAIDDPFFKLHLMSKRPGGPKISNGNIDENQTGTVGTGVAGNQSTTQQPELSRKNSLSDLDMQNAERTLLYNQQLGGNRDNYVHKELDMISLKEGKLLLLSMLKNGVLKFSFLLETCPPGSLPDPGLIAAVLNLKAPVIARAAFFLELANFIHNCNFGNWPQWMKQNFPILRNSGPITKPFCRPNPRSLGQNSNLQRYSGRMFYLWGEAIASHLEELIIKEKLEEEKQEQQETMFMINQASNSNEDSSNAADLDGDQQSLNSNQATKFAYKQRSSKNDDEDEDFLDDKTVNPNGNDCPYALKFAAVSCLTEITTYLRETHKGLKPEKIEKPSKKNYLTSTGNANNAVTTSTSQSSTTTGVRGFASLAKQFLAKDHDQSEQQDGNKPQPSAPPLPEKKIVMTASRRWSIALQHLRLAPGSVSGLKGSSDKDRDHGTSHSMKERDTKETSSSTTHSSSVVQSTPSSHGERRISFVIHEAEGENNSEHSSNTTLTTHDETVASNQHHQAPVKRLSQSNTLSGPSRPNLLNRRGTGTQSISGSSGQQGGQSTQAQGSGSNQPTISLTNGHSGSFKRRSIRLKKDSKSKRTSTLAEEEDSGDYSLKRTDSIRSRRKVSGVSERSDTSDRVGDLSGDESPGVLSDDGQHQSSDSRLLMTYGKLLNFNVLEQDDQRLCTKIPWFKVVNQLMFTLDYTCKHQNGCTKKCFRRQIRSCSKLIKTVSKIYKMDSRSKLDHYYAAYRTFDEGNVKNAAAISSGSGVFLPASLDVQKKGDKKFKPIYGTGSPIKRKVSMSQYHDRMIDRDSGHLSLSVHGSSSFLPHLEVDAGSSSTTVFGYSSSAIQPINLNQMSTQHSNPEKAFHEANRQRLFQKNYMKNRHLNYRQAHCDQTSGEEEFIENMSKFVEDHIRNLFHTPLSLMLKGFLVLPEMIYLKLLHTSWHLILEPDQHLAAVASCAFILCSYKCVEQATELLNNCLNSGKASEQIAGLRKFQIIWKFRYQCWPRMEENAQNQLKLPPPTIEFTLPSPKIALPSKPPENPPWQPQSKYKVEEVTLNQEQTLQKSFVTATKTRRKQQIEMIHKAIADQQEKMREERENYVISSVAITNEASYEPALHKTDEHDPEDAEDMGITSTHHLQVISPIFTSAMCSASLTIINLLNDSQVNENGNAVYEIAYKVIWLCLVEDSALFLRNLFERLTKENGKYILQVLRRIIRFMPRLPAQAAFSLYNYLVGFIMYHVRTPTENSQPLIGTTLSVLWLIVPSTHGLFLKGLKQVLRKEQCDAHVLITANVPSTKRIIVHGPESVGIPSQFNVQEDTQFAQILSESLEYFSIDEKLVNEYYLLDSKSNQIHNLGAFVRDFYFFKRSQYPQLTLTHMDPGKAAQLLQKQALITQFSELGKVLMSLSIVNTPNLAIQRVLFLHEELSKLPSFPRKALESNFQLHHNSLLTGMDTLHKLVWLKLVARMLEVTAGFFAQSNDLHLFLNVVNGALILHCEDSWIIRLSFATFINAAHQFKNIFGNGNGYLLILPTILRIYSNHQTNTLLCKTVEFVCKQFYIMHRKPFLLQMFGSASTILDTEGHCLGDATKVQPKAFFQLLQSMASFSNDPMQILDLVNAEKPLRALDFCYSMDTENISILDTISICVTVIGYAADSQRAFQMLTILEAILPLFMKHNQNLTMQKMGAPKDEFQAIHNIAICIKTLISNCEALTRNFTGPQWAIDLRSSSIKNASKGAYSPMDVDEDSHSNPTNGPTPATNAGTKSGYQQYNLGNSSNEDNEALRAQFRQPRDVLLNVVCEFLTKSTARLAELSKKIPDLHPSKNSTHELLDVKCHLRLAEIAHSLLKVAPYDPQTMSSKGLIRYMNEILPTSDWRQETMRPALIIILRRLDKMFNKIEKKGQIRRSRDWDAPKKLLKGIYSTFLKHPYIVHLPHLKSLINVCQNIVLGDNMNSSNILSSGNTNVLSGLSNNGANAVIGGIGNLAQASSNTAGLSSLLTPDTSNQLTNSWTTAIAQSPPNGFCSVVVRLIALQLLQLNENQSIETICSGIFSNNTEKTEIYLMNMIYPMCIRISGSIREVPKLRTCDITLILSAILNTLNTNTGKTSGGWQAGGINKAISINTLHQIGFLGLKICIVCFERQLSNDWHRIARCIRDLTTKNNCSGLNVWKFFDFIVTYRTPLFILLLPLIKYRLLTRYCDNDEELYYQQQISEKLQGRNLYKNRNLSKGNLLKNLFTELNNLKNLLTNRIDDNRKPNVQTNTGNLGGAAHRLSFALPTKSNILPSAPNLPQSPDDEHRNLAVNMNASNNSSINILSQTATPNRMKNLLNRGLSIRSSISSQSSAGADSRTSQRGKGFGFADKARGLSVRLPSTSSRASAGGNFVDKFLRRTSYPYNAEDVSSSPPGKGDSSIGEQSTDGTGSVPNTGNAIMKSNDKVFTFEEEEIKGQIELKTAADETAATGSFDDGASGTESEPKLFRQKAQSRKMFKNRKSKKRSNNNANEEVVISDQVDEKEKTSDKVD